MALDFFGVQISGRIKTFAQGDNKPQTYELWTNSSDDLPAGMEALRSLAFLQEVGMEMGTGFNSKVSLVLTPTWNEGLALLNSLVLQWGIGHLQIIIGYSTGSGSIKTFPFGGLIQKPEVKIGTDITITLHALGVGYALHTVGGTEEKVYEIGKKPSEIVMDILSKYSNNGVLKLDEKTIFSDFSDSDKSSHPMFKAITAPIMTGPRNDWWFLMELTRTYECYLQVIDDDIRVRKADTFIAVAPQKKFVLRGVTEPENLIFPIMDFSSPTTAVWLPHGFGKQQQNDIGDDKKQAKAVFSSDPNVSGDGVVKVSNASTTGKTIDTTQSKLSSKPQDFAKTQPGNPSRDADKQAVKSEFKLANYIKGVGVDITTIGIPDLMPCEVVQVLGFKPAGSSSPDPGVFDGAYWVNKIQHSIGVGGFSTSFHAISGSFPANLGIAVNQSGETTPPAKEKTTTDRTTVNAKAQ